ncbi:gliding motility protein RemB [uncultured Mucilaginibacter sp.]|uniref:gliding motility protein RemB n=1 Tax=uncultured Mucilaginibacter sp. TaxID=797541 RepID=UPI0025E38CF9|nr:gliding motility protein RemB [uncultured Mucilaginibacter sp.]
MEPGYYLKKASFVFISFFVLFLTTKEANAQLIYQPYSYHFYQKLNKAVYPINSNSHTAVKPYLISDSSVVRGLYDSLVMAAADNSQKSWVYRILFSGHAVEVKNSGYTLNADYLPDLQLGKQLEGRRTTWLNTRGYQVSGTVGSNFFFYTSGYENQGKFANYETDYINKTRMVPGQGYDRGLPASSKDWAYVTALIGYQAGKNITIALGEDKTFIGEGYRSILLSDYASAYPLLRLTVNLGKKVQYMAMWTYMEDQNAVQFNSFSNNRRKWGAFHYVDWNITNRASLGFFNAIISEEANDLGQLRGFDINYINPVYFSSAFGPPSQVADHTLIGFNSKYKILPKTTIYGQLLFDQSLSSAVKGNGNAWQAGFKGWELFKVSNLNYLIEYNTASPFTYSNKYPMVNYAELSEPLADPLGANFKEYIGILNYSLGKFDFQGELLWAKYGLNTGNINYGKDITLADDVNIAPGYSGTGRGLTTTLKYAEGTVAYILNPKYNLRMEIGVLLRQESNALSNTKTILFTVGLRSSFRDLYHDF